MATRRVGVRSREKMARPGSPTIREICLTGGASRHYVHLSLAPREDWRQAGERRETAEISPARARP